MGSDRDTGVQARGNRIVFDMSLVDVTQESLFEILGKLRTRNMLLACAAVASVIFLLSQIVPGIHWTVAVISAVVCIGLFVGLSRWSRLVVERIIGVKLSPDAELRRSVILTRQQIVVAGKGTRPREMAYDRVESVTHNDRLCLVRFDDGSCLPIPHARLADQKYDAIVEMLEDGVRMSRTAAYGSEVG